MDTGPVASWAELEAAAPELAGTVRKAFAVRKHATMATIRLSGAPRISGTEVEFADDGGLYIAMMPGTRRAADLRRDPRVAIHSPTDDPPPDEPAGWLGEAKISGRAVEVVPDRFRIDIEDVTLTKVAGDASGLEVTTWRAGAGVTVMERR